MWTAPTFRPSHWPSKQPEGGVSLPISFQSRSMVYSNVFFCLHQNHFNAFCLIVVSPITLQEIISDMRETPQTWVAKSSIYKNNSNYAINRQNQLLFRLSRKISRFCDKKKTRKMRDCLSALRDNKFWHKRQSNIFSTRIVNFFSRDIFPILFKKRWGLTGFLFLFHRTLDEKVKEYN